MILTPKRLYRSYFFSFFFVNTDKIERIMYRRLGNMILLVWCLSISIITTCDAQDFESREFMKSSSNNETLRKQQESIEELMKQVGDMGMLLENYRRVIVNGITESNDICGFIENLSYPEDKSDKSIESESQMIFL